MATRFDLANLRVQGACCNIFRNGNYAEFSARLIKEIGLKKFNALIEKGRSIKQWDVKSLQEEIAKYEPL